jgi:hypothetical protein
VTDLQRPAEPVVIALPAEIDMANAEDVGDQLRSALMPGVTARVRATAPRSGRHTYGQPAAREKWPVHQAQRPGRP